MATGKSDENRIAEQVVNHEILLDINYRKYMENNEEFAEIIIHTRSSENSNRKRNHYSIKNFYPYFFVECTESNLKYLLSNHETLQNWYKDHELVNKRLYKGGKRINLLKITGKQPWLVPKIRSIFDMQDISYYEADIPFTHRYMIDHQLKGLQGIQVIKDQPSSYSTKFEPKICSLDIEIDYGSQSSSSFSEIMHKSDRRVTAIGLSYMIDHKLKTRSLLLREDTDSAETRFLKKFCKLLWEEIDPDVIVTYNGDAFDWPYLINRMKSLGLKPILLSPNQDTEPISPAFGNGWRIPGVLCYDLYHRTTWMYTEDGRKTLDSVAQELLGTRKIQLDIDHSQLWHASLTNDESRKRFNKYVRRDAKLTRQLWDAMNMPEWIEVIKISGAPPGDAINFTERQSGEFLVFQIMYQHDILIPSAPTNRERKERKKVRKSAKGGLVLDPTRDIANCVLIADFASMYPSIIVAHNIGGESFIEGKNIPTDRFKSKPATSMALMQREMLTTREEVKKELRHFNGSDEARKKLVSYSRALKLVSNSTFGSYNYIGSRFYDYDIASTITQIGRDYLTELTRKAKEYGKGYDAIYGDTDSVFIEMPVEDKVEALWNAPVEKAKSYDEFVPEVNDLIEYMTSNLPEQLLLEFHDIAYRIIFHQGAKKRYAYVSALTKTISIFGFEAVRHDWSPLAKAVQKKAFDLILKSGNLEFAKQKIIEFIQNQLKLKGGKLKELLVTYGPLRKDPEKYTIQTPAIGAYLHHMHKINGDHANEWKDIDYFPYIIIKGDGPQKDRARHPDHVRTEEIDKIHYIKEALRTVNRFNLGITVDEVLGIEYMDLVEYFDKYDLIKDSK